MDEDEEIDIINDDISNLSSGQILTSDYSYYTGGNFWTESVPKNDNINLEQNVEVLNSEEIVIEEPVKISYDNQEIINHDEVVFEADIPASIEEIVRNDVDINQENHEASVTIKTNEYGVEEEVITTWLTEPQVARYEIHPNSRKYIAPTNSRSLLKISSLNLMKKSRSLLKINQTNKVRPITKFKQTLTINSNSYGSKISKTKKNFELSNNSSHVPDKPKFKQTITLNTKNFSERKGFRLHGKKVKQSKTKTNQITSRKQKQNKVRQKTENNITINHELSLNTKNTIIDGTVIKLQKSDSDVEIDIEGEADFDDEAYSSSEICVYKLNNDSYNKILSSKYKEIQSEDLLNRLRDLSTPKDETFLEAGKITDLEKYFSHEFFEGKPNKTPEQYLRIRNHILTQWNSSNGKTYVSKTSVRGLKHCGDVNTLSRIHRLLEQIGAINFGFQGKNFEYVRPLEDYMKTFISEKQSRATLHNNSVLLERRQRTKSHIIKNSCNDAEDINYTIHHMDDVYKPAVLGITSVNNVTTKEIKIDKHIRNEYDLIKCLKFRNSELAPFKVSITLSTLLCLQLHSLTSNHEVMGFLGGNLEKSTIGRNKISLTRYKPCRTSEQSGISCEMDPVSQVEVSAKLKSENKTLLGWFHSHPQFLPNPSRTDILTQKNMQLQFSMQTERPFVGLILSCINMEYKCMYIMPKDLSTREIESGLPYEIDIDIVKDLNSFRNDVNDILEIFNTKNNNCDNYNNVIRKFKSSTEIILKEIILSSSSTLESDDIIYYLAMQWKEQEDYNFSID